METAFEEGIKAAYDEVSYRYRDMDTDIHLYIHMTKYVYIHTYVCIACILYIAVPGCGYGNLGLIHGPL